jgi:hypothetical protein
MSAIAGEGTSPPGDFSGANVVARWPTRRRRRHADDRRRVRRREISAKPRLEFLLGHIGLAAGAEACSPSSGGSG